MFAFLERLFMLLMLVSLARTVVNIVIRAIRGGTGAPRVRFKASWKTNDAPSANSSPASDPDSLLHQDPVCGTYVASASSLKRIVNGQVVHFCSDKCRDEFRG